MITESEVNELHRMRLRMTLTLYGVDDMNALPETVRASLLEQHRQDWIKFYGK